MQTVTVFNNSTGIRNEKRTNYWLKTNIICYSHGHRYSDVFILGSFKKSWNSPLWKSISIGNSLALKQGRYCRGSLSVSGPITRPNAYNSKKGNRQFNSARWHSCPNKTLCRQTKKSLHVSRKVRFCFSWRVAMRINREKKCRKKTYLNQTSVFFVKSCQPREMGLMRHNFNSTLQVTGLPDAIPLAPPLTSPKHIHTEATHSYQADAQKKR